MTKEQIQRAAMELNPTEREALAEELLLSIDDAERDVLDQAWLAEAHCRDAKFCAGASGAAPVDEVLGRLLRKPIP